MPRGYLLRRCWSRWSDVLLIVKPETVIGWHRGGFGTSYVSGHGTVTTLWFGIDYTGRFWVGEPGQYRFSLLSDDGSKLIRKSRLLIIASPRAC
jgi:hypothetical protein